MLNFFYVQESSVEIAKFPENSSKREGIGEEEVEGEVDKRCTE